MDVDRFKYASCGRVLLKAEKRNFLFQEYPGYIQTGALIFCDVELIFLNSNLYRKGSIIAEFKLTFKTSLTAKEAMAPLKQETADGKLGSLEVDSNSLKLKDNNQGKWVEPWIHGISRLNIYMVVEYSSSSVEISAKAVNTVKVSCNICR